MWLRILPVLLVVLGVMFWYAGRPVDHPPGVLAPAPPRQAPVADRTAVRRSGYVLTPVARFEVTARVIGKKRYRNDPAAALAPYDLAIGWGPMSDTAVLERFAFVQTQRVYAWQPAAGRGAPHPIPPREVVLNSTNLHVIPATSGVAAALSRVREGHVVHLRGRLVDALRNDGTRWKTSTSRTDAGVGACEIVLVEAFDVADA